MVEILEVCLGMFQVSFVDESTTDLVVCSDQRDISARREERSRMELVRVKDRRRLQLQVLFHKHPEQEQEWTRTATRELVRISRDERNTQHEHG